MKDLLYKYCVENSNNGLLLIDMPTGSGKTYNIIEFIYDNYENINKKIFFITPLKKNLTYDALKNKFEKNDRLQDFERNFIYIKSNLDAVIENFSNVYEFLPDKIKYDNATKHVKILLEIINSENPIDFRNEANLGLREDWEPAFRSLIENYVYYNDNGEPRNYEQRMKFIREENQWINVLYPASLTDQAKVIFMTVDKFLSMNSTIVRPSYTIMSDSIISNSIIFIDEFDSAKENMLNNIIQNSLNTKVAMLDLFYSIYAGLTVCDFTKKLMTPSMYNLEKKQQNSGFFNPEEVINEIKDFANKIKTKYDLQYLHKLENDAKDKAYFMFQDYRFISVLSEENSKLVIDTVKNENINKIRLESFKSELRTMKDLLFDLKSFFTFFQNGVGFIAHNYKQLKLDLKEDNNLISFDSCVKTVLSEFGIDGKYLNYWTKNIVRNNKFKNTLSMQLRDDLDCSFNEKGFRYYTILDSDMYDTQSKINYVAINDTPEKILLKICNSAKVIGVSASSSLRTVTGNFNIKYLEEKLGTNFFHLRKEEKEYLKNKFDKQVSYYHKTKIDCIAIDPTYLDENIIVSEFGEVVANQIKLIFNEISDFEYEKSRYLKLFYCMKLFLIDPSQYSFLFLTNKLLKENDKLFSYDSAKKIFDMICKQYGVSAKLSVLYGDIDFYEQKKSEIEEKLSNGEKVMVVSSYQTLGAGQNIQYKIPKTFKKDIDYVTINDSDYLDNEKDFDSIYVDKPTNVFVNMNNEIVTEDQFVKFIFQVKSLEENGEMEDNVAFRYIKDGFNLISRLIKRSFKTPENSISLKLHSAKIIQQAIGRICRTKNKSKNIRIYYDKALSKELSGVGKYYKHVLKNPEFNAFLSTLDKADKDGDYAELKNKAKIIQNEGSKYIKRLLNFKNDNMFKWEKLREIVLKNPTVDLPIDGYSLYIELPDKGNKYSYNENSKEISFTNNIGSLICQQYSGLDPILQIPNMFNYFNVNGYATSFNPAKYILSPCMFEAIYKGALGEVAGSFIFENVLNIKLLRIRSEKNYEKFDFHINDVYVDFKNHSAYKDDDEESLLAKFKDKLKLCNGRVALIINIIKPKNLSPKLIIDNKDGNVVRIPYLYDVEKKEFNFKALELIKNIVEGIDPRQCL